MHIKLVVILSACLVSLSVYCKDSDLGPTVDLAIKSEHEPDIPIDSFLYFVPLVSPVLVENIVSKKNNQKVAITKIDKDITETSFDVKCHFSMTGPGSCSNKFDPQSIIAHNKDKKDNTKVLKGLIDYIKFEGSGYGRFEIKGKIKNGRKLVTEVAVFFDDKNTKSPVTVALYDLTPKDSKYDYENRHDILIGRITSLTFKKCDTTPTMMIALDSIGNDAESDSLYGKFRGFIANLLIRPIGITQKGNNSVLAFCKAIAVGMPSFTFPVAANLKNK